MPKLFLTETHQIINEFVESKYKHLKTFLKKFYPIRVYEFETKIKLIFYIADCKFLTENERSDAYRIADRKEGREVPDLLKKINELKKERGEKSNA